MKTFVGALFQSFVLLFVVLSDSRAETPATVTVHGVIRALPGSGLGKDEILIKHEEIPDYRDSSGKVVGMMAMTMPFYLDPGTSLKGLAVGDEVELVLEQQFEPKYSERVVSISKKK